MSLPISDSKTFTIAFYNSENLMDYLNDPLTLDDGFLKSSSKKWTKERYLKKIHKIGMAISKIGFKDLQKPPTLIGLAEVENDKVLNDLIQSHYLKDYDYRFVHYTSPDERGIDVALLYDAQSFTVESSKSIELDVMDELGVRDYTRDILKVNGNLEGEKIHILVNHWPSRHEDSDTTGHKRMYAAKKVVGLMDDILNEEKHAKILVMGDFNDNPRNDSVQYLKNTKALFNPMETLRSYTRGSTIHQFKWMLFDQILMTKNFMDQETGGLQFLKADIFDATFLAEYCGKYKGQPFRTYVGKKYKGGFSDHFPVYVQVRIT